MKHILVSDRRIALAIIFFIVFTIHNSVAEHTFKWCNDLDERNNYTQTKMNESDPNEENINETLTTFQGTTFLDALSANAKHWKEAFFYVFHSDPAFWSACFGYNTGCAELVKTAGYLKCDGYEHLPDFHIPVVEELATPFDVGLMACIRTTLQLQSEYTNDLQSKSIDGLIDELSARGMKPKGIIVNGDLTEMQDRLDCRVYEFFRDESLPSIGTTQYDGLNKLYDCITNYIYEGGGVTKNGVRVYPGLGDMDYGTWKTEEWRLLLFEALTMCNSQMVLWLINHVEKGLNIPMDYSFYTTIFPQENYHGSWAYEWIECFDNAQKLCVQFFQFNIGVWFAGDYTDPVITKDVAFTWWVVSSEGWRVRDASHWFIKKLDDNNKREHPYPMVLNMHVPPWDNLTMINGTTDKERLLTLLAGYPKMRVLSVNFGHYRHLVGFPNETEEAYWCLHGKPVPNLYSGSPAANNYLLKLYRLNVDHSIMEEKVFAMHVVSKNQTDVFEIQIKSEC